MQQVASDRVERAERLVHEQDVGVLRERACQRDALAHAAGELVGPLRRAAEVDELEELVRLARRDGDHSAEAQRELDVAAAVSQGNSADSWNMSALRPVTSIDPVVGLSRPAIRLSSVVLPHPEASDPRR